MSKKDRKESDVKIKGYLRSSSFQRILSLVVTLFVLSGMVAYESAPKKYMLRVGMVSQYDIKAPRDIENTDKTRENAEKKADELSPVVLTVENANTDMINGAYDYFENLTKLVDSVKADLAKQEQETGSENELDPVLIDELVKKYDTSGLVTVLGRLDRDAKVLLFTEEGASSLESLKNTFIKVVLPGITRQNVMQENLADVKSEAVLAMAFKESEPDLTAIAQDVVNKVVKPNRRLDQEKTEQDRALFIETYVKDNPVIIYKDERIISKDDVVTADIFEVLKELNYIDNEGAPDYLLYASVFAIIMLLTILLIMYLYFFHHKIYADRNSVMLLCAIILITTFFTWLIREFVPDYAYFLVPIFIAPVLTSIFLGVEPAIAVNLLLTFSFSLMLEGNTRFMFMSLIGGTFAAYLTVNASQRRKISLAGVLLGLINTFVVVIAGALEKESAKALLNDGGLAFVNGIFSIILAIGLLPFLETTFNVITPLKLLELADPNHPLLKRLLMEAPGTYHHSLLVGNLAEVATREIGGNAILARVGAYYHDVGKLLRPNFFKENQMDENPHDRLTPNLSALVITSHTRDGEELAVKYHLPKVIRDIILQHHGTTLVAYFYHRATQIDKNGTAEEEHFRYEGPLPDSREAAVVMLADSVEAAVRAMSDRTRGKVEGLVRKILKDKLDDGQLDRCDLTLKDISIIADSFLKVLSGIFHERTEYPELEKKNTLEELDSSIYVKRRLPNKFKRSKINEALSLQQAEEVENSGGNG